MQAYRIWYWIAVVVGIISLLGFTYTTILVNNFKTPEKTTDFFKNSNSYYYISEIIKAQIRNRYPLDLKTNVIELAAADTLLNQIVSPSLVERFALPAFRLRQKAAQLPLSFAENDLVLNTSTYTQQFLHTLSSLQLPSALNDAGEKLIVAVPSQIKVVDVKEHPNSILASVTRTKVFFQHLQTALTIFWVLLIVSFLILLFISIRNVRRLILGLFWLFGVSFVIILLMYFLVPAISSATYSNPDPITGALKEQMVNSILAYYFSLTKTIGFVYLCLATIFILLYRFIAWNIVQAWIDTHTSYVKPQNKASVDQVKRKRKRLSRK